MLVNHNKAGRTKREREVTSSEPNAGKKHPQELQQKVVHPAELVNLPNLLATADIRALGKLIPPTIACRYKIVPLGQAQGKLQIAIADPGNVGLLDEIQWATSATLVARKADPGQIDDALRAIYGVGAETVGRMVTSGDQDNFVDLTSGSTSDLDAPGEEASIVRFVNELLIESFQERATDIHIEPSESSLRIRYRIDGILYEVPVPPELQHLHAAIVSRIKIMANLNIAEQRLPQDGRIKVRTGASELDLRISILPTPFGESVNLRILNGDQVSLDLATLGLIPRDLETLGEQIKKPHGIVLLTGPTGSGKTTTLYSCLNRLNQADRKIITVEDPIEYQLQGITQVQVNPQIGLSFAKGLRSMLRHDPDVMLVGEIRDHETAEVTIQVAMTGHLVFSTLHTNDATSAVARLTNMGVEPYLIAASVECIIAQRLVRVVCPNCKTVEVGDNGMAALSKRLLGENAVRFIGLGCSHCKQSGYWGRTALYEFLPVDDEIRNHIADKTPANKLRDIALAKGMVSLRQNGIEKIKRGVTTVEEILRVTQDTVN